jgi:integrase
MRLRRSIARRNRVAGALTKAGIEGCGLHTLRHSFVSRLEERGVSVAIAAELVGHSRITTTQAVYARMRGGREAKLASQRGRSGSGSYSNGVATQQACGHSILGSRRQRRVLVTDGESPEDLLERNRPRAALRWHETSPSSLEAAA